LVRDVHATPNTVLLQPPWAMSFLRGRNDVGGREAGARTGAAQGGGVEGVAAAYEAELSRAFDERMPRLIS
jgi:hypothetical protein